MATSPRKPTLKDTVDSRRKRRATTGGPKPKVKPKIKPKVNPASAGGGGGSTPPKGGVGRRAVRAVGRGAKNVLGPVARTTAGRAAGYLSALNAMEEGVVFLADASRDIGGLDASPTNPELRNSRDPRRFFALPMVDDSPSMFTTEGDLPEYERSLRAVEQSEAGMFAPTTQQLERTMVNNDPFIQDVQQLDAEQVGLQDARLARIAESNFGVDSQAFQQSIDAIRGQMAMEDPQTMMEAYSMQPPEIQDAIAQVYSPEFVPPSALERTDPEFLASMERRRAEIGERTLAAQEPEVVAPELPEPEVQAPVTQPESELPTFERGETTRTLRTQPQFLGSSQAFPGTVDATGLSRQLQRRAQQIQQRRDLAARDQQLAAARAERQFMEQIDPGGTLRRRARGNSDRAREAGMILSQRMRRGAANQQNLFDNAQVGRAADISSLLESDDIERIAIDGASQNVRQQNANTLARQTETASDRLDFDIFRDERDAPFDRQMMEQDRALRADVNNLRRAEFLQDLTGEQRERQSKAFDRRETQVERAYDIVTEGDEELRAGLERLVANTGMDEMMRDPNVRLSPTQITRELENMAVANTIFQGAEINADYTRRFEDYENMSDAQLKIYGINPDEDFIPGTRRLTASALINDMVRNGDVRFEEVNWRTLNPRKFSRWARNFVDNIWDENAPVIARQYVATGDKTMFLNELLEQDNNALMAATALLQQQRERADNNPVTRRDGR